MQEVSPESPEERAKQPAAVQAAQRKGRAYALTVAKRVGVGVYSDGFIHAGNLAYLALVTLFPFFIVAAVIARLVGRTEDGLRTVTAFLQTVPPGVAEVLQQPINDVLTARSGGTLLWLGALVGLWTTGSFIETIRDILRRAYGVKMSRPFWEYRLGSIGLIVGAVILALAAFSFQVVLTGVEQFILRLLPFAADTAALVAATRLAPAIALFAALYFLFLSLTPARYRAGCPKWPGALLVTVWWLGTTALLPVILASLGGYDLTYGSLAGVMIALIFFYLVGLGVVIGAELNAALAEGPVKPGRPEAA